MKQRRIGILLFIYPVFKVGSSKQCDQNVSSASKNSTIKLCSIFFFFFALGVYGQELIFVYVCIKSLFKNSVYTIKCLLYIGLGDKNSKDRMVGKADKIICLRQLALIP